MPKQRILFSVIATLMPFNWLRVFFLKLFFGYDISYSSRIGFLNIILAKTCHINACTIGHLNIVAAEQIQMKQSRIGNLNRIKFLRIFELSEQAQIKNKNSIIGTLDECDCGEQKNNFCLGYKSLFTHDHYVDVTAGVRVGSNVVVAGQSTQIWTHGFDHNRTFLFSSVMFGNNVYIGSRSIVVQGANICPNVTIGAGTIVSKSINEPGLYVSSALTLKKRYA